jgi:hypothetical protein
MERSFLAGSEGGAVTFQRISMLAAALIVVAGCSASASGSPTPSTPSRSPAATAAASSTPAATPAPQPSAEPSPVVLYEVQKNAEGGHGGAPLIALPASIVVAYVVRGTCTFSIDLDTATSTVGPSLKVNVTGPETSGSWHLSIKPGSYYVDLGESVGCTFDVTVEAG